MLGGTLTELAVRQGRVEGLIAWLRELGLGHVEVSDGTIALEPEVKSHLIRSLVANGFVVLSEVGSKDADFIMAPYVWVEQIERDLQAGAWKVIAEARESGTAGIYRADGEVRTGLDRRDRARDRRRQADLRGAAARAAGVAAAQIRHGVQSRQHRARRRALAGDAAARACARTRSSASRWAVDDRPDEIDRRGRPRGGSTAAAGG